MTRSGAIPAIPASQTVPAPAASRAAGPRTGGFVERYSRLISLCCTVLTTLVVFLIFLVQGVILARLLGPVGRGEFGACLYFPRDILLYAGLLGAIDIVAGYAARNAGRAGMLKSTAARLGLITGSLTAVVAGLLAVALLGSTGRAYLIPYALFCCLFLPLEHVHLTVSSVDRGTNAFGRYNFNRLFLALGFPILLGVAWLADLAALTGMEWLPLTCGIWVVSRLVGILPTLRGMDLISVFRRTDLQGKGGGAEVPAPRQLLREGRPYAISLVVTELFERLDIFLVLVLASLAEAGFYFVAVPAAAIMIVAPNALGVFTFNAGASGAGPVSRNLAVRVMLATAAFQLVTALLFATVVDDLILFCFSDRFANAIPLVLLLLPAAAIRGFLQAADGYLKGRGRPMVGVRARLVSIGVMLAFVAVAWPGTGLASVPIAAGIGQAFSMIVIVGAIWLDTAPVAAQPGEGA